MKSLEEVQEQLQAGSYEFTRYAFKREPWNATSANKTLKNYLQVWS